MANLTENKLDQILTPAVLTSAITGVNTVRDSLPAGSLTDEQRASLPSISVGNKVFSDDVLVEMGGAIAAFLPNYVSAPQLTNDLGLYNQLDQLMSSVNQLQRKISDLMRIAGNEGYSTSLAVYKMVEMASEAGIPGAKESYDKLKVRFMEQGGKGGKPKDEMPTGPVV